MQTASTRRWCPAILGLILLTGWCRAETVLRMAFDADPVSMDPHEQLSGATLQMSHWLFDPLVRRRPDFSFEPRLAQAWEQPDPRTTVFHLRRDVTFHSGNAFTADDMVWTFERIRTSPDFKALFAPVAACERVDAHTVRLVTHQPYPLVLALATYLFPMDRAFYSGVDDQGLAKDLVRKHANTFASRSASGTGPFRLGPREPGIRTDFIRHPGYWDDQSPGNIDRLVLTPIRENATRVSALLAGDVDFIAPVAPADLPRLERDRNVDVLTLEGTRIILLQLNQQRQPAFRDARVRQAFDYAIQNQAITTKIMRGFATPAGQLSPPSYVGHAPDCPPRYDPERARELLAQAGYGEGLTVSMLAPNNRYVNDARIAEAVVYMLARVGVTVELRTLPKAQYWPEFDARAADVMMIGWHSDTEDSGNFYEFLAMTPDPETGYGQYNSGNYSNPEVDRLVLAGQTESNPEARRALFQQVERTLYREAAFVPLHWQNLAYAWRRPSDFRPVLNPLDMPYLGDAVLRR